MKVKSVVISLLLSLFVVILNSCDNSNPLLLPGGIDLQFLVRGFFNYPLTGSKIKINGTTYSPDSDGMFYARHIICPYDLYLYDSASSFYALYKDLRISSGVMNLPLFANQLVDYDITVNYPTLPSEQKGKLYYIDYSKDIMAIQNIETSSNIHFSAPAGLNLKGRVILITYTKDGNGHIYDYKYFAMKQDVPLSPGTNEVVFVQSDLSTVDEYTVNCTLNLPQGNTSVYADYQLNFDYGRRVSGYSTLMSLENFTTNTFSVVIPTNLPHTSSIPAILYVADGTNGDSRGVSYLPDNASSTTINIPSAPGITSPPDNAVNVDTNTIFSIDKNTFTNVIAFTLYDTAAGRRYSLYTTESSLKLSMFSSMVTLTPGRRYTYSVEQVGVYCENAGDFLRQGQYGQYFTGTATGRSFTTKP